MDLQQQFEGEVTFIGVPEPAGDTESASEFVERTESGGLDHIHDPNGDVWRTFGVTRRQTYLVIDADGTVQDVPFGDLAGSVAALVG